MRTLLCLLLVAAIAHAAPDTPERHVFVYVDGSVPGPGTGTFSDPFPTILDAMNYVIPHDYVFVRSGTYNEAVNIPFFVYLRSTDGPDKTMINATGLPGTHAVTMDVLAELTGFTVTKQDGAGVLATFMGTSGPSEFGRIVKENRIVDCPQGGLDLDGVIHPTVVNNLIANCGSFGIRVANGASPYFTLNTITANSVGLLQSGTAPDSQAFFANSILWGNATDVQGLGPSDLRACDVGDPAFSGVNANLSVDPQWRDGAGGDYRLLATSQLVDAGDPSYTIFSAQFDARGYGAWRTVDGDHDGSAVVDIGAYERGGCEVWQTGAGVGSSVSVEIDTGPSTQWFLAISTMGEFPTQPLPNSVGYLFLDLQGLALLASGFQGTSGITTLSLPITSPAAIGVCLAGQAAGYDATGTTTFTNAERVIIN